MIKYSRRGFFRFLGGAVAAGAAVVVLPKAAPFANGGVVTGGQSAYLTNLRRVYDQNVLAAVKKLRYVDTHEGELR